MKKSLPAISPLTGEILTIENFAFKGILPERLY